MNERSPFSRFDARAHRVVVHARARADGLGSRVIDTEHLLLGLLSVRRGLATRTVTALAGRRAEDTTDPVRRSRPSPTHLPFTAEVEQAVTEAARQATLLGDERLGTEHLLLGLLATPGTATSTLAALGVDYDGARAEISRLRRNP